MKCAIRLFALCTALAAGAVLPTSAEPADPGVMLPPAGPTATFSIRGRQYWVQVTAIRTYPGTITTEDAMIPQDSVFVRIGARDGRAVNLPTPPSITLTYNGERWTPSLVPLNDSSATVESYVSEVRSLDWPSEANMTASMLVRNRRQAVRVILRDVRLYTAGPTQ